MDKMARLARDVQVLEEKLGECTRCGVCQGVCPLFRETRREADVSRGKLALINGLIDGIFDDAKGVDERLQRCLLCGACAKGCPSGVNPPEIILFAKEIIARYLGLPFGQKILFKNIVSNPERFNRFSKIAASFQRLFFKTQKNVQATSCARVASPLLRHRNIIPLKDRPFQEQLTVQDFRQDGKGLRVAFFVGCVVDKAFPHLAFDVIKVLNHFNAQVYVPGSQGCCGMPALSNGDSESFEKLVALNTRLFAQIDADYLVTACATCASTIIKLWPAMVKNRDILPEVEKIAERTVDISWLLVRRFGVSAQTKEGAERAPVTYHDPCHLKKSLDVFDEPRTVIQASGHPLVEMTDSDACCGMGGSFNLKYYELSKSIGQKKAGHIVDTGCSAVATSCPACMMQLSDMLAGMNAPIGVTHPISLFAKTISD